MSKYIYFLHKGYKFQFIYFWKNNLFSCEKCTGHYNIVLAILSVISSSDNPQLLDYVQPVVASGDSGKLSDFWKGDQTHWLCSV